MSRANQQESAREISSSADKRDSSTGATKAWPNSNNASLSVCAHHRRMMSRRSRPALPGRRSPDFKSHATSVWSDVTFAPAVLVTLATPSLSGARGTTSAGGSEAARLGRSGGDGRTDRAPRLNTANSRGAGAAVGGDRAVGMSRGAALDGQTSGPTLTEQDGALRATTSSFRRRTRAGSRPQKRGRQNLLHR